MASGGAFLFALLVAAAVGWHLVHIGVRMWFRNEATARTAVLFAILAVVVSSLVPDLPHSAWPESNRSEGLVREVARAANPAFTIVVLAEWDEVEEMARTGHLRAPERLRRLEVAVAASLGASGLIGLAGLALHRLGARRRRSPP